MLLDRSWKSVRGGTEVLIGRDSKEALLCH